MTDELQAGEPLCDETLLERNLIIPVRSSLLGSILSIH